MRCDAISEQQITDCHTHLSFRSSVLMSLHLIVVYIFSAAAPLLMRYQSHGIGEIFRSAALPRLYLLLVMQVVVFIKTSDMRAAFNCSEKRSNQAFVESRSLDKFNIIIIIICSHISSKTLLM